MAATSRLLIVNAGSSTLKYALFAASGRKCAEVPLAVGLVEQIGEKEQQVTHTTQNASDKTRLRETGISDHEKALHRALSLLGGDSIRSNIQAVGHRVVHGGEKMTAPSVIDNNVVRAIRDAIPLAPLHNPSNLMGIQNSMKIFPQSTVHVAVFDTAFHATLPAEAYLYGIPYDFYTKHGMRRYGFHGTSHGYVAQQAAKMLNRPLSSLNLITCHLGAGSSLCCIRNGQSIDTTMGMTPLEGLIMASRCGDLDPSIIFHLVRHFKMSLEEIETMLNRKSGWFGLGGHKDMREVRAEFERGEQRARDTVLAMAHRVRRYLGAYYWYLGGKVDAIVFTAGVGENWPAFRRLCLQDTEVMGFQVEEEKNKAAVGRGGAKDVSGSSSKGRVLVIPTNEELSIAEQTLAIVSDLREGSSKR